MSELITVAWISSIEFGCEKLLSASPIVGKIMSNFSRISLESSGSRNAFSEVTFLYLSRTLNTSGSKSLRLASSFSGGVPVV